MFYSAGLRTMCFLPFKNAKVELGQTVCEFV
jgi:hypothetical protein